jgi:hypothetical protein
MRAYQFVILVLGVDMRKHYLRVIPLSSLHMLTRNADICKRQMPRIRKAPGEINIGPRSTAVGLVSPQHYKEDQKVRGVKNKEAKCNAYRTCIPLCLHLPWGNISKSSWPTLQFPVTKFMRCLSLHLRRAVAFLSRLIGLCVFRRQSVLSSDVQSSHMFCIPSAGTKASKSSQFVGHPGCK